MADDIPKIDPEKTLSTPDEKLLEEGDHDLMKLEKLEIVPDNSKNDAKIGTSKIMKKFKLPKIDLHHLKRWQIFLATLLTSTFLISFLLILFGVMPALALYRESDNLVESAKKVRDSASSQDINVIQSEYENFKSDFYAFEKKFDRIYWMSKLPFVGGYVRDARYGLNAGDIALSTGDLAIETIKPYADLIGLGGADSAQAETANDRIDFLVNTIDEVLPQINEISDKINLIQAEVDKIDVSKYPEEFRGRKIREPLANAVQALDEGAKFLSESKPLLERASYLLGVEEPRRYMLVFQNDNELRPTGGFISAYAILNVTNGKIENVDSNDIYDLDAKYTPTIEAPKVIVDYLGPPYNLSEKLVLRDMNWNPDFVESYKVFMAEAEKAGIKDVDGVIAVDTDVVVNILDVIGPIAVPGYGEFSTNNDERCNCPNVIYELADFANNEGAVVWCENEPGKICFAPDNYGQRKIIIGPLMNSVLQNALGQPKEKMADLFAAGWRSVNEKHVMVYLFDGVAQSGAEGANMSGRINQDFEGDYLHINDANLGGRKSNLYVTYEVQQDIEVANDGSVTKTVAITYSNPQSHDGWLNSVLPNWTRVYVPQGAELISADGFDADAQVYDELGKTVFAGGFELRPEGLKKVTLTYKLPQKFENKYDLMIQKQPGKDFILHTINIGKKTEELFLRTDKEFQFSI